MIEIDGGNLHTVAIPQKWDKGRKVTMIGINCLVKVSDTRVIERLN